MNGVVITGPTAAGKSALGLEIAARLGGEIVSIDSRQIYRRLDIGTAKPTLEERGRIRHHCIDILDITEKSNARWFADRAREAIDGILSRGSLPVLAGGSGLYLRALMEGLFDIDLDKSRRSAFRESTEGTETGDLHTRLARIDPDSAARIHVNDRYRILRALEVWELTGTALSEHFRLQKEGREDAFPGFVRIGLDMDRRVLRERISERTGQMFNNGWPEEVSALLGEGADPGCPGLKTLGYPETIAYVKGEKDREAAVSEIATLTSQYAKRQMTWFRKEPAVHWLDAGKNDLVGTVLNLLDSAVGS